MADTEAPDEQDGDDKPKKPNLEKVLERARKRFSYVADVDKDNRDSQREDTKFVYVPGEQWPADTKTKRTTWGDPCMEFPQLKQFVSQVVNDERQNRPGVRIHAAGDNASEEVAEILQGLFRGIEYDSRADAVYDCAYQHSVVGGRGYWRIGTEYVAPDSFDQKIVFKRIPDPLSVYLDPDYKEPDGSDREYGFIVESVPKDEFPTQYPEFDAVSWDAGASLWYPEEDHVLVADYYERVSEPRTLVATSDGSFGWKDTMPALPKGVTIVATRKVNVFRVDWYTIAGGEQARQNEWANRSPKPGEPPVAPATIIPIVCTMGDEITVDGKRIFQGLITQAKDSQTLFNFGMTQQAISLALTPRAPYVAAVGQIEGVEDIWKNANTRNYSVLPYIPTSVDGTVLPAPQRQAPATPDAGWINWTQQMTQLMRSTIGMYQNSLGMQGQETSGRAIVAREKQGDNATFHFQDNLSRAIALTGRITMELIPHYYDAQRIVNIVGPDDVADTVTINQAQPAPTPEDPTAAIINYNVTVGRYAVTVQAGPSYATKRQETAELTMQLVNADPALLQIAGDIVVKAQDIPEADQIAERMQAMMPPPIQALIAAKKNKTNPDVAQAQAQTQQVQQQAQQQMQALQQQMQQLQQENQQLKLGVQAKVQVAQIEAQTKDQEIQSAISAEVQKAQQLAVVNSQAAADKKEMALQQYQLDLAAKERMHQMDLEQELKIANIKATAQLGVAEIGAGRDQQALLQQTEQGAGYDMGALMTQLTQAITTLAAPKELVRGPDGRAIGVRHVPNNGTVQ